MPLRIVSFIIPESTDKFVNCFQVFSSIVLKALGGTPLRPGALSFFKLFTAVMNSSQEISRSSSAKLSQPHFSKLYNKQRSPYAKCCRFHQINGQVLEGCDFRPNMTHLECNSILETAVLHLLNVPSLYNRTIFSCFSRDVSNQLPDCCIYATLTGKL